MGTARICRAVVLATGCRVAWATRRDQGKVSPSDVLKSEQQLAVDTAKALNDLHVAEAILFGDVIVSVENGKIVAIRIERNHKLKSLIPELKAVESA